MNAVKRCLTVLAVALVAGACGGDPTAEDAGTNLSIRATPTAVWMRDKATAEVLLEAADKLGGAAAGSWEVSAASAGLFTVTYDSTYQGTTAGAVGVKRRFVITSTAEGDGEVTFSGTGGSITIPVRVAPDTLGLDLVFSAPVQVGDTVTVPLNASVTAQLQPGLRFSSNTTVILYTGPLSRDTSIFKPINFSIAADSTTLSFTPGPNSTGRARITGIANTSTPGLATFARTAAILKTDQFDTAGSSRLALSATTPPMGTNVTVTLPAEYRFSPNTTVNHFTLQPNGATLNTNGQAVPAVISVAADSGSLVYLPPPGSSGQPRFTNIRVRNNATSFVFAARALGTVSVPAIPNVPAVISANPAAPNTAITLTMPAGTKLRPTSQVMTPGGTATTAAVLLPSLVIARAADSSSITIIPQPGFDTILNVTALVNSVVPVFSLTLPTSVKVRTAAPGPVGQSVPSLGADDATADTVNGAGVGSFTATLAAGETTGFWDLGTWGSDDWWGFGGPQQDIKIIITNAGNYTFTVGWDGTATTTDIDVVLDNASLSADLAGALTGANPEVFSVNLAAGTYYLLSGDFAHTHPKTLRISIKRNS